MLGTLVICLEIILGKGDRALWLLMLWIPSYLHTDFGPASILFLLHQFLLLYWITQTNGTTNPPPSYYPKSLSPFLAKLHRRVFSTSYLLFLLPILSSLCCNEIQHRFISLKWFLSRFYVIFTLPGWGLTCVSSLVLSPELSSYTLVYSTFTLGCCTDKLHMTKSELMNFAPCHKSFPCQ